MPAGVVAVATSAVAAVGISPVAVATWAGQPTLAGVVRPTAASQDRLTLRRRPAFMAGWALPRTWPASPGAGTSPVPSRTDLSAVTPVPPSRPAMPTGTAAATGTAATGTGPSGPTCGSTRASPGSCP